MNRKVIGIETGFNKKFGTPFTIVHTVSSFDDYSIEHRGAVGSKCESTYIRDSFPNLVIGDIVEFSYQPGWNNEAVVSGINIIKK